MSDSRAPPRDEADLESSAIRIGDISSHFSMIETLELARLASQSQSNPPTSILITGKTGTGKEVLARAIHNESPRKDCPFIAFNCSGVPDTLIESELFGYGKGAFTGAYILGKKGLIEVANEGTLFLDEIGEMPITSQAKILRVLQDQMIRRLGENSSHKVDVRIIAATNRNLQEAIEQKLFREDLFYRLNVFEIPLPPLRERPDDVLVLAEKFRIDWATKENKTLKGFTAAAREVLQRHSWPGNIRELQNVVHHAVVRAKNNGQIDETHFPKLRSHDRNGFSSPQSKSQSSLKPLREALKDHVLGVLHHTGGNHSEACAILQINKRTLKKHAGAGSTYRRQPQPS